MDNTKTSGAPGEGSEIRIDQPTDMCECNKTREQHINTFGGTYCSDDPSDQAMFTLKKTPEQSAIEQTKLEFVKNWIYEIEKHGRMQALINLFNIITPMQKELQQTKQTLEWAKQDHETIIKPLEQELKEEKIKVAKLTELLRDIRESKDIDFILSMYPAIDAALLESKPKGQKPTPPNPPRPKGYKGYA